MVGDAEPAKSNRRQSDSDEQRSAFYFIHSVRHGGAAKQCLWLGPSRYFCGCERRIANTDTYSESNPHIDAYCHTNTGG
jgi:hypothetical protein